VQSQEVVLQECFVLVLPLRIFIYITVNLSMVLGLLPIVGSPLPIMSYGGSSMLATMIGFGIVLSAKIHSQQTIA
jgi:rod shape determining protein RodA